MGEKAAEEAARYGKVNIVASSADTTFDRIPELDESKFDKHADYFYITLNNTIYGTRWTELPNVGDVPLVGDMVLLHFVRGNRHHKVRSALCGCSEKPGPAG